jgi:exopolyphosphatase/guanosine-5'-triphosphate,3'-diphosphate pyrophosphatase
VTQKKKTIAVLDIGSNSICMVVYEGRRAIFNEKIRCPLGADLSRSGRLHVASKTIAADAVAGFVSLARAMRVDRFVAIATSAIRDAKDGRVFIKGVQKKNKITVRVISGDAEARLSARGVLAAFPAAKGVMMDMGGGSAEIARIEKSRVYETQTLPLGTLRMLGHGAHLPDVIDAHLDHVPRVFRKKKALYLVGGTFRWLAKVHMEMTGKQKKLQGYALSRAQALKLARFLSKARPETLQKKYDVDINRAVLLGPAALLLEKTVRQLDVGRIVFCASGLREGVLHTVLSGKKI